MKTVKQVSDLTGISVRTLHYYDEIGLLSPSETTDAGYRLYDDKALESLQQILFFKELDFPLREVKEIMENPGFNRMDALKDHRKLLVIKRNRLNELINLVDQTLEGADTVSFKEFDMSEYFDALDTYKKEHADEVVKYWGSIDKFNEFIESAKSKEERIAETAIKQYGSIEKYTEAMKSNLRNMDSIMEGFDTIKKDLDYYMNRSEEVMKHLTSDLNKSPVSDEIQKIVKEMEAITKETHEITKMDMGENYWGLVSDFYLNNPNFINAAEKKYGVGSAKFIGEALKYYSERQ
ncbi:MAG TPA: MerR family transcriptional regulator [Lachnospiraceae bacterium]|nr:MerR family transcriptional regulator [Lachnospiraceae bacterium]